MSKMRCWINTILVSRLKSSYFSVFRPLIQYKAQKCVKIMWNIFVPIAAMIIIYIIANESAWFWCKWCHTQCTEWKMNDFVYAKVFSAFENSISTNFICHSKYLHNNSINFSTNKHTETLYTQNNSIIFAYLRRSTPFFSPIQCRTFDTVGYQNPWKVRCYAIYSRQLYAGKKSHAHIFLLCEFILQYFGKSFVFFFSVLLFIFLYNK